MVLYLVLDSTDDFVGNVTYHWESVQIVLERMANGALVPMPCAASVLRNEL